MVVVNIDIKFPGLEDLELKLHEIEEQIDRIVAKYDYVKKLMYA